MKIFILMLSLACLLSCKKDSITVEPHLTVPEDKKNNVTITFSCQDCIVEYGNTIKQLKGESISETIYYVKGYNFNAKMTNTPGASEPNYTVKNPTNGNVVNSTSFGKTGPGSNIYSLKIVF